MRPVKLFFLSLCVSLNCFSVDARTLLNAVETGDITSVMQLFDEMQALSTEHSLALINDLYSCCVDKYGVDPKHNKSYIARMSTCRNIFKAILKSSEMECGLQSYDNEKYMIYLCRDQDQDVLLHIPGCMVIGGVEVFCGVLIWILPVPGAQVVGGFMIGDGITRTLDGVTEMSEKNQQRQANRSPWH